MREKTLHGASVEALVRLAQRNKASTTQRTV
jgi:hypothetical protein